MNKPWKRIDPWRNSRSGRGGVSQPARKTRPQLEELEERAVPNAGGILLEPPIPPANYAVLFSGGVSADINHAYYYDNIKSLYQTITQHCNVLPQHVFIIYADGQDPAADRDDGKNSDMSYAAGATVLSATRAHLFDTLQTLAGVVNGNDHFLFYSFDHGSGQLNKPSSDGEMLCGWGAGQNITDSELATRLRAIHAANSTYVFAECFAGGMLDDLMPLVGTGNYGCAATNHYESSWGDGFAAAFVGALQQGLTDTQAVFQYAKAHDPFTDPTPYGDNAGIGAYATEHPWGTGDNFPIFQPPQRAVWVPMPLYRTPLFDFHIGEQVLQSARTVSPLSIQVAALSARATPNVTGFAGTGVSGQARVTVALCGPCGFTPQDVSWAIGNLTTAGRLLNVVYLSVPPLSATEQHARGRDAACIGTPNGLQPRLDSGSPTFDLFEDLWAQHALGCASPAHPTTPPWLTA
jgi:hypothetical protein